MNNKKITAIIYARTSGTSTTRKEDSLQEQERVCKEYCEQNGMEVKKVFHDLGAPALDPARNMMRKILRFCKQVRPDFLIVTSRDRLNRSVWVRNEIISHLLKTKTTIRPINETN